jgi:hypothetical protein
MSRYLLLIFMALFLVSCSEKMDNPVSSNQTDKNDLGKVSFSMSIPVKQIKSQYGFSIDSVTVRLQGPTNISGKLTLSSDTTTATGTFSNLVAGNYLISVAMFSGVDTIATGSGTATVLPGQQAVANITLSFLGSLTINVTLPLLSVSAVMDSIQYTFTIPKATFGIHDTLVAIMTAYNQSYLPKTIVVGPSWFSWTLKNESGRIIMYGPTVVPLFLTYTVINSHQSNEIYSVHQAISDTSGAPVIAGSYVLSAEMDPLTSPFSLTVLLQ